MAPGVRTLMLAGMVVLASRPAHAQRGLDRALTSNRAHVAAPPDVARRPGLAAMTASADTQRGTWLLQPLGSVTKDDNDIGMVAGYKRLPGLHSWGWQVTGRGLRQARDGTAHGGWQIDAEVDPTIPGTSRFPLLAALYAIHTQTFGVERSDELEVEIDAALTRDTSFTAGLLGYYDWLDPETGRSSHGSTFGLTASWSGGPLTLAPEYDFASAFGGGKDSYSLAANLKLLKTAKNTELSVRGGWKKGDNFSLRVQLGVADVRRHASRLAE